MSVLGELGILVPLVLVSVILVPVNLASRNPSFCDLTELIRKEPISIGLLSEPQSYGTIFLLALAGFEPTF